MSQVRVMALRSQAKWLVRILWPLTIIALLLLLEGASKLIIPKIWVDVKEPYSVYYSKDPDLKMLGWLDDSEVHPYFGYVTPHFHKQVEALAAKTSDDYVIGIFGGSVAQIFGNFLLNN